MPQINAIEPGTESKVTCVSKNMHQHCSHMYTQEGRFFKISNNSVKYVIDPLVKIFLNMVRFGRLIYGFCF